MPALVHRPVQLYLSSSDVKVRGAHMGMNFLG